MSDLFAYLKFVILRLRGGSQIKFTGNFCKKKLKPEGAPGFFGTKDKSQ